MRSSLPGSNAGNTPRPLHRRGGVLDEGPAGLDKSAPSRVDSPEKMSIVYTLKKLVDPIRARQNQDEYSGHLQQAGRQNAGPTTTFECGFCGYRHTNGSYCPECLADTMRVVSATRLVEPDQ